MDELSLSSDPERVAALHTRKNAIYATLVEHGAITPRPGVVELIETARRSKIALAIATTTSRANVDALLTHAFGAESAAWFAAIVCGEDVARKKPDPEVYLRALDALGVDAGECVAIEDSRNGLDAALAAGLITLVTPSFYFSHERFERAAMIAPLRSGTTGPLAVDALEALVAARSVTPG